MKRKPKSKDFLEFKLEAPKASKAASLFVMGKHPPTNQGVQVVAPE